MKEINSLYEYRIATTEDLNLLWDKNIAANPGNNRWVEWKKEYMEDNSAGKCTTFAVFCNKRPIGEGTLLFSPACGAIGGRVELADANSTVNVNALRIEKPYEGKGHISKLVRHMECYAASLGYQFITIGVEAGETRNLAIYLHWGYNTFIQSEVEDGALVLYYSKSLEQTDT